MVYSFCRKICVKANWRLQGSTQDLRHQELEESSFGEYYGLQMVSPWLRHSLGCLLCGQCGSSAWQFCLAVLLGSSAWQNIYISPTQCNGDALSTGNEPTCSGPQMDGGAYYPVISCPPFSDVPLALLSLFHFLLPVGASFPGEWK